MSDVIETLSERIVEEIIYDMHDRGGGDWFDRCSQKNQESIREAWEVIVKIQLSKLYVKIPLGVSNE